MLDWDCSDQLQHLPSEHCNQPHWVSVVDSGGVPAEGHTPVLGRSGSGWNLLVGLDCLAIKGKE